MNNMKIKSILKANIMLIILCLLMVLFGVLSPNFLKIKNLMNICTQNAYLLIAAIGVSMIMISGGADLSTGYNMSVVGVCVAILMQEFGVPVFVAVLLGILLGGFMGIINGMSANILKIHPIVVTLATMTIYQGLSYTISQSRSFFNFAPSYKFIGQGYIGMISVPVIIAVIIAFAVHFVLEKTCFGRFIYATGGNEEAARLAGVDTKKIRVSVFMLGGILFAVSAIVLTARGGSANSTIGPGTEFDCLTGCVLGGISFTGGEGKVKGVVTGCLILGVLSNGMQLIGMGVYAQYIVKGIILMLSIGYDTYQKNRRMKKITSVKAA